MVGDGECINARSTNSYNTNFIHRSDTTIRAVSVGVLATGRHTKQFDLNLDACALVTAGSTMTTC